MANRISMDELFERLQWHDETELTDQRAMIIVLARAANGLHDIAQALEQLAKHRARAGAGKKRNKRK